MLLHMVVTKPVPDGVRAYFVNRFFAITYVAVQ